MARTETREISGRLFVDVILTDAEHANLERLGRRDLGRVCSLAGSDLIGLGRFAPVDTVEVLDDDGVVIDTIPAEGTDWRTSFPADLAIGKRPAVDMGVGEAHGAALAEVFGWALTRGNEAKVQPVLDDMALAREIDQAEAEGEPDQRTRPDVSEAALRDKINTARGRAVDRGRP